MRPAGKLFDDHAGEYEDAVTRSASLIGGHIQHFAQRKVDLLGELLPGRRKRVLDFGCGVGVLTWELARAQPAWEIVGIDVSEKSIARAHERLSADGNPAVRFVHGRLGDLRKELGRFELVVAACVFHHIPPTERAAWAGAIRAALEPGGSLVLFEHNPRNPLTRRVVRDCPFDEDAILLNSHEALSLCRGAGFHEATVVNYLFLPPALYRFRRIERWLRSVPFGGQYAVVATVHGSDGPATA